MKGPSGMANCTRPMCAIKGKHTIAWSEPILLEFLARDLSSQFRGSMS